MSNYTKNTNWTAERNADSDPALLDAEFDELAVVSATKADLASPTFTGTPTLPTGTAGVTQTAGDNSTKLATTAFVEEAIVGTQTWSNPTRSSNTLYTNSTGRMIYVSVSWSCASSSNWFYCDGVALTGTSIGTDYTSVFPIPNGSTYQLGIAATSIQAWAELR